MTDVIAVSQLHKRYDDKVAVADVSFRVEAGEIFGLLGPNGAGKTTTVECLSGLRVRDGGSISVLGLDPGVDRRALVGQVGVQLQESALPARLRVGEALDLYASFYPDPVEPRGLAERLGLTESLDRAYGKLSGGQQQRLSIALALVGRPRLAILDELSTGLDPQARRETWRLVEDVRDSGVTVVLVTHLMAEAQRLCDRIAVIDHGRVVALDTPDGLVSTTDSENRLTFRPSGPVDEDALRALPEVRDLHRDGRRLVVTGDRTVVQAVMSALARDHVVAEELRIDQTDLDDAFVALTAKETQP